MADIQSVKTKIQGLIDKANTTTGGSDTDLTTAMDNLIGGYGSGGNESAHSDWWTDKVVFWDYDGTMVASYSVEDASKLTSLPTPPTHEGLTFQGWNYTLEEVRSANHILDVGAVYIPTDEKTHIKFNTSYNGATNLSPVMYYSTTVADAVTIDWGDGTIDTVTTTGAGTTTHKYATGGIYEIVVTVADGCVFTMGQGTTSTALFYGSTYAYKVEELYVGKNVEMSTACFNGFHNLTYLTICNGITLYNGLTNLSSSKLRTAIIPRTATQTEKIYKSEYKGFVISFPNSIATGATVESCPYLKRVVIPDSLEETNTIRVYSCYKVVIIYAPITPIRNNSIDIGYCYSLRKIITNEDIQYLPLKQKRLSSHFHFEMNVLLTGGLSYAMQKCYRLKDVILDESVQTIGDSCFSNSCVDRLIIKGILTSQSSSYFFQNGHVREVIFTQTTPPTGHNFKFYDNYSVDAIYVTDESLDLYKTYIDAQLSNIVYPLSKYRGDLTGIID